MIGECQIFLTKLRAARTAMLEKTNIIGLPQEFAGKRISTSFGPPSSEPSSDGTLLERAAEAMCDLQAKLAQAEDRGLANNDQLSAPAVGGEDGNQGTCPDELFLAPRNEIDALPYRLPELVALER